jgi:hypothetical protein
MSRMSDYSESGALPVEDAAVPDPPTENDDSAGAPAADPTYDEPGDNLLAADADDD